MPKKLREKVKKIRVAGVGGGRKNIKIHYLAVAVALGLACIPRIAVQAESCPDLRVIFARGSGGEWLTSGDYLEFKSTIESKLETTALSYEFIDLEYPAVGVGFSNVEVAENTLGAFFSGGESYTFGNSVKIGVENLKKFANDGCKNTKYVLGGYSQGAMVLLKTLPFFNPEQIIYVATFGDPKIYLPEGEGIIPAACRGENLSSYRMYVPDCQAYKGILGSFIPYAPDTYIDKVGTWCNKRDILCSSHLNISDHTGYVSEGLYEDASRVIFDKITTQFGIENHISSPHDTAFLIDSTGSMSIMIDRYKAEALRLATETLNSGGRVALYDYRDLSDPYAPIEHCNFETCTLEVFENELATIQADGGGDTPESLLSASYHAMQNLNWKYGSTKSLVILTDANFLSPDRDGMTLDEVVALSKRIDPVNFYIITKSAYGSYYTDLVARTDGKVVTNFDELDLLTDYIMERYDSLPRVEESEPLTRPTLEIERIHPLGDGVVVGFNTNGRQTLVILNDTILGTTDTDEVIIGGLDSAVDNVLTLVPLGEDIRGEGVAVDLSGYGEVKSVSTATSTSAVSGSITVTTNETKAILPKTPNTGKR